MVLLFSSKSSFDEHSPFELRLNQTCGFYGPFAPVGDFKPILKEDQIKYIFPSSSLFAYLSERL